jgi:hypothetical protein
VQNEIDAYSTEKLRDKLDRPSGGSRTVGVAHDPDPDWQGNARGVLLELKLARPGASAFGHHSTFTAIDASTFKMCLRFAVDTADHPVLEAPTPCELLYRAAFNRSVLPYRCAAFWPRRIGATAAPLAGMNYAAA